MNYTQTFLKTSKTDFIMKPLTREIVFDQVLLTLSHWWELGYRNMPHGYKDLILLLFPNHIWGQKHASFIKSACTAWEEKYGTEIGYLMPNLEPNASKWISIHRNKSVSAFN